MSDESTPQSSPALALRTMGKRTSLWALAGYFALSLLWHIRAFGNGAIWAAPGDALTQNYPAKLLYASMLKSGVLPLWNPYEFTGMPFMGSYQAGAFYPPNIVLYGLLSTPLAYNLSYILHFALAAYFTYLLARSMDLTRAAAFASGAVYGFSGIFISHAAHIMITSAAAWLPLVMYFAVRLKNSPNYGLAAALGLVVSVQAFAGNFQICIYTYMLAGAYFLYHALWMERRRALSFLALGALGLVSGLAVASVQILATQELSALSFMGIKKSFMGYRYFSEYHFYLSALPGLLFPNWPGGAGPLDHVPAMLSPVVLAGALAAIAGGLWRGREGAFWAAVAGVSFALALGPDTPLHKLMYEVPVYNKFRVTGRHFMEFVLAMSILCAMALDMALKGGTAGRRYLKLIMISAVLVSMLAAGYVAYASRQGTARLTEKYQAQKFQNPVSAAKSISNIKPIVWKPLVFVLVFGALAGAGLWLADQRRQALGLALAVFVVVDVGELGGLNAAIKWPEGRPPVTDPSNLCLDEAYAPRAMDAARSLDRVVSVYPPAEINSKKYNSTAQLTCGVGSVTGYNQLIYDTYSNLLDLGHSGFYSLRWEHQLQSNVVLSMLGGRYVSVSNALGYDLSGIRFQPEGAHRTVSPVALGQWTARAGATQKGAGYVLVAGQEKAELLQDVPLEPGGYEFCMDARALAPDGQANGYIAIFLYKAPQYNKTEALFVHPDYIDAHVKTYCQSLVLTGQKARYLINVEAQSSSAIEVTGVRARMVAPYAPVRHRFARSGDLVYREISRGKDAVLYENLASFPRAWAVSEALPVRDPSHAMAMLNSMDAEPSTQVLIEAQQMDSLGATRFVPASVKVTQYEPNEVRLHVDAGNGGSALVVLADQYDPGWRVQVDGKDATVYRADAVLRAVQVPSGSHEVRFYYRPSWLAWSAAGSMLTLVGLVLACVIASRGKAANG